MIATFIISVAGFIYVQGEINTPYNIQDNIKKEFVIQSGESVQQIADNLRSGDLISDTHSFKFYVWQEKVASKPPGFNNLKANKLISLYPLAALSANDAVGANLGGSNIMTSNRLA